MKHVFLFGIFGWLLSFTLVAQTGIWQWSVPVHNFSTHPKNPESSMGHRTKRFFQWSGKMGERL